MITLTLNQPILARGISILKTLNRWERNTYTRKQLKTLSAEQLNDIGVTKQQAIKESRRPFWS
ncbi:MAG: DUF1127 domain-containing protein [Saccharospirillaceae bacterium]|nr:DUF1127 domain-containing protein [Pseudomonadales bacterium]NRB78086.1 DUF1127 domain-containing protein [Saccharospirillaceae bacterium]